MARVLIVCLFDECCWWLVFVGSLAVALAMTGKNVEKEREREQS